MRAIKLSSKMFFGFSIVVILNIAILAYLGSVLEGVHEQVDGWIAIEHLQEADRDAYQSRIALTPLLNPLIQKDSLKIKKLLADNLSNLNQVYERFGKFKKTYNDNSQEFENRVNQFLNHFTIWKEKNNEMRSLIQSNKINEALSLYQKSYGKAFSNTRDDIDQLTNYTSKQSLKKNQSSKTFIENLTTIMVILILFFSFILSFIGYIVTRSVSKPIQNVNKNLLNTSQSMHSAASQVSSSGQILASSASELASSVEEMTASMEELQSTIEANTKIANEGASLSKQSFSLSARANKKMNIMKASLAEIHEHSQQIEKINKVIDDIAFQTNILALNAAVEAARAGDAGRGFVVVSEQVKNLAGKSAEAAKETAELIQKAAKSVKEGQTIGEEVFQASLEVAEMDEKVEALLQELNLASQEQLKGANQVTQGISQINNVVQQTASSSEELASTGGELLGQSERMSDIVHALNKVITGKEKSQFKVDKIKPSQPSYNDKTKNKEANNYKSSKVDVVKPQDKIPLDDFEGF